jgi:hypothetical protein
MIINNNTKYDIVLVRFKDRLVKRARSVKFIEWDSDEVGAKMVEYHDTIPPLEDTPFSVILDPSVAGYSWLTTPVQEYHIEYMDYGEFEMEFKTKNSFYVLTKKLKYPPND